MLTLYKRYIDHTDEWKYCWVNKTFTTSGLYIVLNTKGRLERLILPENFNKLNYVEATILETWEFLDKSSKGFKKKYQKDKEENEKHQKEIESLDYDWSYP